MENRDKRGSGNGVYDTHEAKGESNGISFAYDDK